MKEVAKVHRSTDGFPIISVSCTLISDCDFLRKPEPELISQVQAISVEHELAFRIYRTNLGLRVICVSDIFRASSPASSRLLRMLGCDERYLQRASRYNEFSARIGGKPTRMGIPALEGFNFHGLLPKERREWEAVYDEKSRHFKACEFVAQTRDCDTPSPIVNFIKLHDERSKCYSDLPMA
jgi:hypothetical protein